ncbi:MAG TPA: arylamine N-acetyltransferase [Sporosarcina sp.]|nr:arylamine N-acetyltransferase [Sporosarcina sp.]
MNIQHYLKRFSSEVDTPSLTHLTSLQNNHIMHIPFENLDVIRRVPIYLNLETMYEKIVHQNRGGYCYELNGLFQYFLSELGYACHLVGATVMRPDGSWAKEHTHAAIVVDVDQPYLVDVGFGAYTPRVPIPLGSDAKTPIDEIYATKKVDEHVFDLIWEENGERKTLYRFHTDEKSLIDFHEGCIFNQVSTQSTFTHVDIVSLGTKSGRLILQDHLLKEHCGAIYQEHPLTAEEKTHVLAQRFSICLN